MSLRERTRRDALLEILDAKVAIQHFHTGFAEPDIDGVFINREDNEYTKSDIMSTHVDSFSASVAKRVTESDYAMNTDESKEAFNLLFDANVIIANRNGRYDEMERAYALLSKAGINDIDMEPFFTDSEQFFCNTPEDLSAYDELLDGMREVYPMSLEDSVDFVKGEGIEIPPYVLMSMREPLSLNMDDIKDLTEDSELEI